MIGVLVGLNLIYLALVLLAQPAGEHPFLTQFVRHPLVMAHRGGGGLRPENTLYAFQPAVTMGVEDAELLASHPVTTAASRPSVSVRIDGP